MGDVHRLPNSGDTEREASAWFARMNADDVSDDDRSRFESWLRAHSANAKAYAALSTTWQELVESGPLVRAVYFGQAMNAASASPAPRRRWAAAAVAAGIGAIVLGGAWNLYKQKEETRFQTAIGEQVAVALPDGSSFDLNTDSRIWVDYSQRQRVIRLEHGEAFFKVAHDTQRPFWVRAGDYWVRAVGTAFNVYLTPTGVEVTVSEGTVNVVHATTNESPPSDAAITQSASPVTAGEQADVHGRAEVIHELNSAQLSRLLAWRKSSLYFQDQPLGDVVNELMRYTTLRIEFDDDQLRHLPVGGTFQTSPEGAEALLTMLHDGFGTTIRRDGQGHVYIEGPAK
ncbi:MAG TPA: FecR domain-containing protein [Steroidobacteraceae bacterium]|nr:FecR domain-containing protein [Steroidobacteraceae bacterium]